MEVSSTITLTWEGSGKAKHEELAVAGALVGVAGPALASPSSLKIWLAARIFRGIRCDVLRWDDRRDGGGAGVSDTGWIGRAASKFCRASATTSEGESMPIEQGMKGTAYSRHSGATWTFCPHCYHLLLSLHEPFGARQAKKSWLPVFQSASITLGDRIDEQTSTDQRLILP